MTRRPRSRAHSRAALRLTDDSPQPYPFDRPEFRRTMWELSRCRSEVAEVFDRQRGRRRQYLDLSAEPFDVVAPTDASGIVRHYGDLLGRTQAIEIVRKPLTLLEDLLSQPTQLGSLYSLRASLRSTSLSIAVAFRDGQPDPLLDGPAFPDLDHGLRSTRAQAVRRGYDAARQAVLNLTGTIDRLERPRKMHSMYGLAELLRAPSQQVAQLLDTVPVAATNGEFFRDRSPLKVLIDAKAPDVRQARLQMTVDRWVDELLRTLPAHDDGAFIESFFGDALRSKRADARSNALWAASVVVDYRRTYGPGSDGAPIAPYSPQEYARRSESRAQWEAGWRHSLAFDDAQRAVQVIADISQGYDSISLY